MNFELVASVIATIANVVGAVSSAILAGIAISRIVRDPKINLGQGKGTADSKKVPQAVD